MIVTVETAEDGDRLLAKNNEDDGWHGSAPNCYDKYK